MIEPFKKHFGPVPDITVLLTGDVAECLARARKRDISKDALEPGKQDAKQWAKVEIQTRIQFAYIMNLANQPRTLMVDTRGKGLDAVCAEVVQRIKLRLDAPIPRQSSIFSVDDCAHQEHRA
jgi:thymidylate kinase